MVGATNPNDILFSLFSSSSSSSRLPSPPTTPPPLHEHEPSSRLTFSHVCKVEVCNEILDPRLASGNSSQVHYVGLRSRESVVAAVVRMICVVWKHVHVCVRACVRVCVCVCKREKK